MIAFSGEQSQSISACVKNMKTYARRRVLWFCGRRPVLKGIALKTTKNKAPVGKPTAFDGKLSQGIPACEENTKTYVPQSAPWFCGRRSGFGGFDSNLF
jgi:hypothetical protein